MRYAVIIEIENEEELTSGEIERTLMRILNRHFDDIVFIEAAEGKLKDTFGVGN